MTTRSSALFAIACQWLLSAAMVTAQTGTGLTGKYYDTDSFGTLKTTRTDATVDFNFGTAIPSGTAHTSADTSRPEPTTAPPSSPPLPSLKKS